jgi:hypothetical protein
MLWVMVFLLDYFFVELPARAIGPYRPRLEDERATNRLDA